MRVDDKTRRRRMVAAMVFVVVSTSGYALLQNWSSLAHPGLVSLVH